MKSARTKKEALLSQEAARLSFCVTNEVYNALDRAGITRAELARRMAVSKPYVTKMLDGQMQNFTLKTLASVGMALGIAWGITRMCDVEGWVADTGDPAGTPSTVSPANVPSPSQGAALAPFVLSPAA